MRGVEARERFLCSEIIAVLWEECIAVVIADGAGIIDRLRPGITRNKAQSTAQPLLQLNTDPVIIALAAAVDLLDAAEFGIRRPFQNWPRARNALVEGAQTFELPSNRSQVTDFEQEVVADLALHIKHILDDIGRATSVDVPEHIWIVNLH